jgi:hypothetical protein
MIGPIATPSAAADANAARAQPWVLAATIVASSMVFIDSSVVNVALPAIQAALAAPVSATLFATVKPYCDGAS